MIAAGIFTVAGIIAFQMCANTEDTIIGNIFFALTFMCWTIAGLCGAGVIN